MKTRTSRLALALAFVAGGILPLSALAQTEAGGNPAVITYQGEARNAAGQPLQGAGEVRFELFDLQTAGVQKGTAGPYAVTFTDGRFTADAVAFTPTAPATDAYGTGAEQRWLQISVRAPGSATFVTLTPRQRLTQTPFAKVATKALNLDAAGLTGTLPAAFVNTNSLVQGNTTQTITGAKTFNNAGNIFVGNGSGLTNVAAASYGGPIGDGQLSSNVALLNRGGQTFSQNNIFSGNLGVGTTPAAAGTGYRLDVATPSGFPARFLSPSTGGTWATVHNTSAGGHEFNLIATGSANGEGAGKLLVRDGTASAIRMVIDDLGRVGMGTISPGAGTRPNEQLDRFELAGPDVGFRIHNTNDQGGGILWNSFGALHMGIYNPAAVGAFGQVQPLDRRAFFSINADGRVGSTTNTGGSPLFRNFLDDGAGNFIVHTNGSVQGQHVALFENTSTTTGDGIAIKINNLHCSKENNFVTFLNGSGTVTGRIEGYQLGDWIEPPPALTLNLRSNITINNPATWFDAGSLGTFDPGAFPSVVRTQDAVAPSLTWGTANVLGVTVITPPINFNSGSPPIYGSSGGRLPSWTGQRLPRITGNPLTIGNPPIIADLPTQQQMNDLVCWGLTNSTSHFLGAELLAYSVGGVWGAAMLADLRLAYDACAVDGVTYGSKGADYAEWLERANPAVDIGWGEVVGVKGGKVSRDTEGAEQVLVVSRAPIILGNTPPEGRAKDCEKVAFMGQVPVMVQGKVHTGDYIIASGLANGAGIAVAPENLSLAHLSKLVGRAWEDSKNDQLNFVNTAIGINQQAAQHVLAKQQKAIDANASAIFMLEKENDNLRSRLQRIEALLILAPESK